MLNSLTAKYVAIFVLLVAVPAIAISWYLLDSSYSDSKRALIRQQQAEAQALAGRIEQTLFVLADSLGTMHGQGLSSLELESLLTPLQLSRGSLHPRAVPDPVVYSGASYRVVNIEGVLRRFRTASRSSGNLQ